MTNPHDRKQQRVLLTMILFTIVLLTLIITNCAVQVAERNRHSIVLVCSQQSQRCEVHR